MSLRDQLVAQADSFEQLIELAEHADPQLAEQLGGKAAIYSKTIYAVPCAAILSWVVAKYGLGWSADTQTLVVFLIGTGTTWLMRCITNSPITSIFHKDKPHASA